MASHRLKENSYLWDRYIKCKSDKALWIYANVLVLINVFPIILDMQSPSRAYYYKGSDPEICQPIQLWVKENWALFHRNKQNEKTFCQLLVVFREETLQYSVFVFPFQSFVSDNRYSKVSLITIQFVCLIAQYFWCPKKIQAYNTFSSDDEGLYLQNLKMTYHTASIMQHPTPLLSSCSFSEIPEAKTFCLKMQF